MTKSLPLTEPLDGPHKSVLDVIGNFSPKRKERKYLLIKCKLVNYCRK